MRPNHAITPPQFSRTLRRAARALLVPAAALALLAGLAGATPVHADPLSTCPPGQTCTLPSVAINQGAAVSH